MKGTVAREVKFTFGEGQAEGIDNVTLQVAIDVENPLLGTASAQVVPITVQLPHTGWDENDAIKAAQERFPEVTLEWETAPVVEAPAAEPQPEA